MVKQQPAPEGQACQWAVLGVKLQEASRTLVPLLCLPLDQLADLGEGRIWQVIPGVLGRPSLPPKAPPSAA